MCSWDDEGRGGQIWGRVYWAARGMGPVVRRPNAGTVRGVGGRRNCRLVVNERHFYGLWAGFTLSFYLINLITSQLSQSSLWIFSTIFKGALIYFLNFYLFIINVFFLFILFDVLYHDCNSRILKTFI